jgi:hypothetical protein
MHTKVSNMNGLVHGLELKETKMMIGYFPEEGFDRRMAIDHKGTRYMLGCMFSALVMLSVYIVMLA